MTDLLLSALVSVMYSPTCAAIVIAYGLILAAREFSKARS